MPDLTKPVELKKIGQEGFRITWEDGHACKYSFQYLRQKCECAACRSELTGEPILDPESVPVDLKCLRVDLVGNYALHFQFSDGHASGIYPFTLLRRICPCARFAAETEKTQS